MCLNKLISSYKQIVEINCNLFTSSSSINKYELKWLIEVLSLTDSVKMATIFIRTHKAMDFLVRNGNFKILEVFDRH